MPQVLGNQMYVLDHPFVTYMKALKPHDGHRLMSFYIPLAERWSIGMWINRDLGEIKEFISLGPGEEPTRDHVDTILFNLMPERVVKAMRDWMAKQHAKVVGIQEMQADLMERHRANRLRTYKEGHIKKEDPRYVTTPWSDL